MPENFLFAVELYICVHAARYCIYLRCPVTQRGKHVAVTQPGKHARLHNRALPVIQLSLYSLTTCQTEILRHNYVFISELASNIPPTNLKDFYKIILTVHV